MLEAEGRVDVVVNNAGVATLLPLAEMVRRRADAMVEDLSNGLIDDGGNGPITDRRGLGGSDWRQPQQHLLLVPTGDAEWVCGEDELEGSRVHNTRLVTVFSDDA